LWIGDWRGRYEMEDRRWERKHGEKYLIWWLVATRMGVNGFWGFEDYDMIVGIE
jgi:hypothetical protein